MEYAYPPWPVSSSVLFVALSLLFGLALFGWFVILRWKNLPWAMAIFGGVIALAFCVLNVSSRNSDLAIFIQDAFILILCVALGGLGYGLMRLFGGLSLAVVIAGLTVLILPLILPNPGGSKRAPLRMRCMNQLRILMSGLHHHATNNHGHLPPPVSADSHLSWRVQILPYVDAASVYKAYQRDKAWDDPMNEEYSRFNLLAYACPGNLYPQDSRGRYYSAYAMFTGVGSIGEGTDSPSLDEIAERKGLSQTAILGEACGRNIVWNEPRDVDVNTLPPGVNLPGKVRGMSDGWLSSVHGDTANIALADGSVRSMPASIDLKVLKALTSPERSEISLDGGLR